MALPTSVRIPRTRHDSSLSYGLKEGSTLSVRSQDLCPAHSSKYLHSSMNLSHKKDAAHKSTSTNILPASTFNGYKKNHDKKGKSKDDVIFPPVFDWWIRRSNN